MSTKLTFIGTAPTVTTGVDVVNAGPQTPTVADQNIANLRGAVDGKMPLTGTSEAVSFGAVTAAGFSVTGGISASGTSACLTLESDYPATVSPYVRFTRAGELAMELIGTASGLVFGVDVADGSTERMKLTTTGLAVTGGISAGGNAAINCENGTTLTNGQWCLVRNASDTSVTLYMRGLDGVMRSVTLTLA